MRAVTHVMRKKKRKTTIITWSQPLNGLIHLCQYWWDWLNVKMPLKRPKVRKKKISGKSVPRLLAKAHKIISEHAMTTSYGWPVGLSLNFIIHSAVNPNCYQQTRDRGFHNLILLDWGTFTIIWNSFPDEIWIGRVGTLSSAIDVIHYIKGFFKCSSPKLPK